jgi:hypothetical protein
MKAILIATSLNSSWSILCSISSDRVSYIASAAITPIILADVVIITAAAKVIVKECICEQALNRPRMSSPSINPTGTTALRSCD